MKILKIAGIVFGILLPLITIYFQFIHKENIKLNIQKVSEIQLATPSGIEGIESMFIFNDSVKLDNLWSSVFKVENIGNQTILSKDFKDATLIDDCIPFTVENGDNILSIKINNQNVEAVITPSNQIKIKQWRPEEFIEVSILSANEKSPQLKINDREIADADISYSEHAPAPSMRFNINLLLILTMLILGDALVGLLYRIKSATSKGDEIYYISYGVCVFGAFIYFFYAVLKQVI